MEGVHVGAVTGDAADFFLVDQLLGGQFEALLGFRRDASVLAHLGSEARHHFVGNVEVE